MFAPGHRWSAEFDVVGFGVVPTKVVEKRCAWNWSSFAETSVWMTVSECGSSDQRRWLTFGGSCSRGRSDSPSSKLPCVAIFTLSVWQLHHRKFLVVMGAQPRKMPFLAIDQNLTGRRPGGLTQTLQPNVSR